MRLDRTGFSIGVAALGVGLLALWANYGHIDWRIVGMAAPVALVVIGVGILLLPRNHPRTPERKQP